MTDATNLNKAADGGCPLATCSESFDTPETDAAEWTSCDGQGRIYVDSELARKLERERDQLRSEMKELYNLASFDWATMPQSSRRKFREVVLETAERALSSRLVRLSDAEKYADPSGPRRMSGCSQERVEEQLRIALDGHPESALWGENGLIAATMREARMSMNSLQGKLVSFDCDGKTLGFRMDEMPSTAMLGERVYLFLPNA